MRPSWLFLVCVLTLGMGATQIARAQNKTTAEETARGVRTSGDWPLERVHLKNGKSYSGLIVSTRDASFDFVEIVRRKGKPMHLLVRPIRREDLASINRLSDSGRRDLEQKIRRFRNRARIEAGRIQNVPLTIVQAARTPLFRYEGEWFGLDSTLDATSTRKAIVRLEQVFLAFRQIVPPRSEGSEENVLRLKIFGTQDTYRRWTEEQGIAIKNPAFFDARRNLIVAGSDVRLVVEQFHQVQAKHRESEDQQRQQIAQLPATMRALAARLEAKGVESKERRSILSALLNNFQNQQKALTRKLATAERKNQASVDAVVDQLLRRLNHEAFHAYLDNFVYSSKQHDVPRWLNEGLAQIFENGLLEADTLRVDAPDSVSLKKLQADLKGSQPLRVIDVLSAGQTAFLVPHDTNGETSERHYLYSWGLAYYLTFETSALRANRLNRYVQRGDRVTPVERFEQLVNMPLEQFERQWRTAMLALKAP